MSKLTISIKIFIFKSYNNKKIKFYNNSTPISS